MILNNVDVNDLARLDPILYGVRGLRDANKYDTFTIPAGAMAREINFFNVRAKAPGITNWEKPGEVNYPLWIFGMGLQIFGTGDDIQIVSGGVTLQIVRDKNLSEAFPANCLPGGGGLTLDYSPGAGAAVNYATHGLNNSLYVFATPIFVDIDQNFRVAMITNGETLAADTIVRPILRGLESHPAI